MTNPKELTLFSMLVKLFLATAATTDTERLSFTIRPQVITTKTVFTVAVDTKDDDYIRFKYIFGSWVIETDRRAITYRYERAGNYELMVIGVRNVSREIVATKKIVVFDHDAVNRSQCSVNIWQSLTPKGRIYAPGDEAQLAINITLTDCYGACKLYLSSTTDGVFLLPAFMAYGDTTHRVVSLNFSYCSANTVNFEIVTIDDVINEEVNVTSLWNTSICRGEQLSPILTISRTPPTSQSESRNATDRPGAQSSTSSPTAPPVKVYGKLNVVVAVIFTIILGFYLCIAFLSYLENKKSARSVLNLTDFDDEVMYEVQFHVGNGFSVSSTACEIQFKLYGSNNSIGPVLLPVSLFEQDGIASFLISSKEPVGEIGTVAVFCKEMDLRSDWYLRKVEILSHSQKPSGSHWSDSDIIKSIVEFECHTWFQPAVKADSVAQVFHVSTIGKSTSILVDFFNRCHQLFFQKHILTSWRCDFGVRSFSKVQRLSFLYSLWFAIICMSSVYLVESAITEDPLTEHRYHIGVIRLDEAAINFALTRGVGAYAVGIVVCFIVNLAYRDAKDAVNSKPAYVDNRGRKAYDRNGASLSNKAKDGRDNCRDVKCTEESNGYINNGYFRSRMDLNDEDRSFSREDHNGWHALKENLANKKLLNSDWRLPMDDGNDQSYQEHFNACRGRQNLTELVHVVIDIGDPRSEMQMKNYNAENDAKYGEKYLMDAAFHPVNDANDGTNNQRQLKNEFENGREVVKYVNANCDNSNWKEREATHNSLDDQKFQKAGLESTHGSPQRSAKDVTQGYVLSLSDCTMQSDRQEGDDLRMQQNATQVPSQDAIGDEQCCSEMDGNGLTEDGSDVIEVRFVNRETLPTSKNNFWKMLLIKLSSRIFWVAFTILLLTCLFYTLVNSTNWSHDTAYHWLSYHTVALFVSCFFIDTVRVLLYILSITLKERKRLKSWMKRLPFSEYAKLLLASKHAGKEKEDFCRAEYPDDKMKFAQDHKRLQGKFRDFGVLGIFVLSLLTLTAWTVDKNSFHLGITLANDLFNLNDLHSIQKFKAESSLNIDPIANFWTWFDKMLYPVLDSSRRDVSLKSFYLMERTFHIVQKRVIQGGSCKISDKIKPAVTQCSSALDKSSEDFVKYAPGWKKLQPNWKFGGHLYPWEYRRERKLRRNDSLQLPPSLEGYTAGFDLTNSKHLIKELQRLRWVDKYSRLLHLETFVYEPAINILSQVLIKVEFTTTGYVDIQSSFYNFMLFPELAPNREILQISESVFVVLTIYFAFDILKRKRRTSASWISLWLVVETMVVLLSLLTFSLYFYKNSNVYLLTAESNSDVERHEIIRSVVSTQKVLEVALSVLTLFAMFFFTKPLFTLGLFDDMYTAVCRTMRDMKGIAMETVILMIGLGCWATLAFAPDVRSFSSLRTTFPALMGMLVQPDKEELSLIRFFGPTFLLAYFCIMILIVTNIFISSVETSYSEAREVFDQIARETVFKLIFKKSKMKRMLKDRGVSFKSRMSQSERKRKSKMKERKGNACKEMNARDAVLNSASEETLSENALLMTLLERSVGNLEAIANRRIPYENIEDRILISTLTENWSKYVEKRPPLRVISMYKPTIRK